MQGRPDVMEDRAREMSSDVAKRSGSSALPLFLQSPASGAGEPCRFLALLLPNRVKSEE